MDVIITDYTRLPVCTIGDHAGTSTGKGKPGDSNYDTLKRRVENCFKRGHMSVFEAASVNFYISGISRSCSHQLVRHRLMSFCQESQRYTKVDVQSDDWYVEPITLTDDTAKIIFKDGMKRAAMLYQDLLQLGMKPEDARFVLPEATKTNISVFTNLRELFAFLDLREDQSAQWEIRNLAFMMEKRVRAINDGWKFLMDLRYRDGN